MSSDHGQEVDPITGYDTTGHDWNGIRELNTPFPMFVFWILMITVAYSIIAWLLLPAWPTGRAYTRGLLGLDQGEVAVAGLTELTTVRQDWLTRFAPPDLAPPDFAALQSDAALLDSAMPAASRLFADNCAACHGPGGAGGPGFPMLADDQWLWAGDPETVAETIRLGINSDHPDTRVAQMPPFDWLSRDERLALAAWVAALPQGNAPADAPAAALFAENCAACHGDEGEGGLGVGAPSLIDPATIYGQDPASIAATLLHGRQGVMPAWSGRLSEAEINLLALYVSRLHGDAQEAAR
jgi:cytochrome c oxidase cbb3-type subunit 3